MDLLSIELPSYIKLGRRSKIPFSTYLNEPIGTKHTSSTFQFFLQLPAELQLKILESCDARTMFKLMQTCSSIRKDATKLFWSQKDLWYHISGLDMALSIQMRKPDSIYWNSEFVKHIEQVEIEFGPSMGTLGLTDRLPGTAAQAPVAADAERYRSAFQRAFPSAKRILISDTSPYRDEYYGLIEDLTTFARAFQTHYTVFCTLLTHPIGSRHPRPKTLYRLDSASQWTLVQRAWTRESILPPTEKISGIVGMFVNTRRRDKYFGREYASLHSLRHDLYEKYHFSGPKQIPFICPRNGCDVEFKTAGEWRDHITGFPYSNHDRWVGIGTESTPNYTSLLPTDIENALVAKELTIQKAIKEISDLKGRLWKSWGKLGSERRRRYTEQFVTQLKSDPLCKCQDEIPENSAIFRDLDLQRSLRD